MLFLTKELQLEQNILDIELQGDHFTLLDTHFNLAKLSRRTFEIDDQVKLAKNQKPLHAYSRALSISSQGYMNVSLQGTKKSFVLKGGEKVTKHTVNTWHNGDVESSCFSEDSKLLATAGNDGKVYVFNVESGERVSSLPSRPDYAYRMHFSEDLEYLATCSYDKNVFVFNLERHREISNFFANEIVEDFRFIHQGEQLYFVTRAGSSVLYDLDENQFISLEHLFADWPTRIAVSPYARFAIVGTRGNKLHIIRLKDNALVESLEMKHKGITLLKILEEYLVVGYEDGFVEFYDYVAYGKPMEVDLKLKKYEQAAAYLKKNVLLLLHPATSLFDQEWPATFERFKLMISSNKVFDAMRMVKPFLYDSSRQKQVDEFMLFRDMTELFARLVKQKDIPGAYILTEKNENLKNTPLYDVLEREWMKIFTSAKRKLREDPGSKRNIELKLRTYMRIKSKREMIEALFEHVDVFVKAEKCVKEKNFEEYFRLLERHPFLEKENLHQKILGLYEKLYEDFCQLREKGEYQKAKELSEALLTFRIDEETLAKEIDKLNHEAAFAAFLKEGNYPRACQILEKYPGFKRLEIYKESKKQIELIFSEANSIAAQGKIKETRASLQNIANIPYFAHKVESIVKFAYVVYLEKALEAKREKLIPRVLQEYVRLFDADDELKTTCVRLGLTKELEKSRNSK